MQVYYSMIIWILIIGCAAELCPQLAYKFNANENRRQVRLGLALFTMAYIIIIIGLRSGVGDTPAYITMFDDAPSQFSFSALASYEKDQGYFALSMLFKQFVSTDFHIWFLLIAAVSGCAVAYTLYKYSENFFFSMFLFMAMVHFVWMLNGMRQFIAVSILFASTRFLIERKFLKYLMVVLLVSTIHITALIMIPVYFIVTARPWGKIMWIAVAVTLGIGLSLDRIAASWSFLLEDSAYEGYLEVAASSGGSNLLRSAVAIAPPLLALVCKRYTEQARENRILNISIIMSVLSAVTYLCSSFSGGILVGRLPIYFDMYNMLLLPWLVKNAFTKRSQSVVYLGLIVCYLAFFYSKAVYGLGLTYISDILPI